MFTGCFHTGRKGSDGLLLLLNKNIPESYDVYFNGWDRTNNISLSGAGIHHPGGDYKKISTYGKILPSSITWLNSDSDDQGMTNAHWNIYSTKRPTDTASRKEVRQVHPYSIRIN